MRGLIKKKQEIAASERVVLVGSLKNEGSAFEERERGGKRERK